MECVVVTAQGLLWVWSVESKVSSIWVDMGFAECLYLVACVPGREVRERGESDYMRESYVMSFVMSCNLLCHVICYVFSTWTLPLHPPISSSFLMSLCVFLLGFN